MESDRRASLKEIGNFTASAGAAPSQESRQRKSDYGENPAATKPRPVITGDSQAHRIAKFARTRPPSSESVRREDEAFSTSDSGPRVRVG